MYEVLLVRTFTSAHNIIFFCCRFLPTAGVVAGNLSAFPNALWRIRTTQAFVTTTTNNFRITIVVVNSFFLITLIQLQMVANKNIRKKLGGKHTDIEGYCKAATLAEVKEQSYVLTPGRYVGSEMEEDDGGRLRKKWRY